MVVSWSEILIRIRIRHHIAGAERSLMQIPFCLFSSGPTDFQSALGRRAELLTRLRGELVGPLLPLVDKKKKKEDEEEEERRRRREVADRRREEDEEDRNPLRIRQPGLVGKKSPSFLASIFCVVLQRIILNVFLMAHFLTYSNYRIPVCLPGNIPLPSLTVLPNPGRSHFPPLP